METILMCDMTKDIWDSMHKKYKGSIKMEKITIARGEKMEKILVD
jgi:hypothetical protein